jgi:2-polyprenyl-3-methyl-5-hydroxy-6-metoxy-1,4-benzoquinol methylase
MSEYKDYNFKTEAAPLTLNYLLDPILEMISDRKDRKIIDVGCGSGWLCDALIQKGFDAYGIDASETGIEIAKRRNKDRFFLQDLSKDEPPAELDGIKFDTVISTEVIEHLYAPRTFIDFCKRILQKSGGGEFLLTTPYHGYLKNVFLAVSGKMDTHFNVLRDGGHIKFWSVKTVTQLLEERGFKNVSVKGCGRLPYLWMSMLVKSEI